MKVGEIWRMIQSCNIDGQEIHPLIQITSIDYKEYDKQQHFDKKGKLRIEFVYYNDYMVSFSYLPEFEMYVNNPDNKYCVYRKYFLLCFERA